MQDIQVLAPIYRGPAGINKLNELLQDILNRKMKIQDSFNMVILNIVKMIKYYNINRPDDNVFNGDIGGNRCL